jgi:AcrR family transcriptional regulator
MGRPKEFTREDVLLKAIPVFWKKGFSKTTLQDLERATGVNKSGLYSEFRNKKAIFVASIQHYLRTRGGDDILSAEPQGWENIQRFLEIGQTCYTGRRGCFSVNSLRDVVMMPSEAKRIIADNSAVLKGLLIRNIKAERLNVGEAGALADLILTFFAGLCIEENVKSPPELAKCKVANFMSFLRGPR